MRVKSSSLGVLVLAVFALSLQGCGGGSSDQASGSGSSSTTSSTDIAVDLRGSVGDGPVVGAQLTVTASSGETLQNAVSDQQAGYNIQFKTKGKYYPLLIAATGGTDLVTNRAPDFALTSMATQPGGKAVTNLNPFTTLAIAVAKQMSGGLTDTNVANALTIVVAQFDCGLASLANSGVMSAAIDDSNLAEIVKSSETLSEILRRTNAAMVAARGSSTIDAVINALAADLVDGTLDGQGAASGTDPEVSAVAAIISAQVLMEAMTNTLQVDGQSATAALDNAINTLASSPMTAPTASVPITAAMIDRAERGVAAANAISPSTDLQQVLSDLGQLTAGMLPADVAAILPSTASASLDGSLTQIQSDLSSDVNTVNTISADGVVVTSTTTTTTTGSGTGAATLSWTAPTQNTDGTALTDLAGYKVYWGTSSGNYSSSVTLNNPGLTSYVVDTLSSGTYYFSVSALNSSGVESVLSNEASKTIP